MFFFENRKLKTPSTYRKFGGEKKRSESTLRLKIALLRRQKRLEIGDRIGKNKGSFYKKTRHRHADWGSFVAVAQSEACKGHFMSIFRKVIQGDSVVS
jgi:hypothetical protein